MHLNVNGVVNRYRGKIIIGQKDIPPHVLRGALLFYFTVRKEEMRHL